MPGASRKHNLISLNCGAELRSALRKRNCEVYSSDMRVKVSTTGLYTYPDVFVVCDAPQFEDDAVDTLLNPLLLIEVLSETTEKYDRGTKAAQYRTIPSLHELVFVAQDYPSVESLVRQENGTWVLREQNDLTQSMVFESLQVSVPLSEIYSQVTFSETTGESLSQKIEFRSCASAKGEECG